MISRLGWSVALLLGVHLTAGAADFAAYRGFKLGATLAESARQAGVPETDARNMHQRPALMQELDWRPAASRTSGLGRSDQPDPAREGVLRFYNGTLFQIVTLYDRQLVEGLTEADMVEAISRSYGAATRPKLEIAFHSNYGETATVLARWETAAYSCDLIRTGDQSSFALVLSEKALDAKVRLAEAESARLDTIEGPQRALDLDQKQRSDERKQIEAARLVNRPNFRP